MPQRPSRRTIEEDRRRRAALESARRTAFLVTNADGLVAAFDDRPTNWYNPRPEDPHLSAAGHTLDEVLARLAPWSADPEGLDGLDLAVWRGGRLLALVRRGGDGRPEVLRPAYDRGGPERPRVRAR